MDPNNNVEASPEKYSLRPRKRCEVSDPEDVDCTAGEEIWTGSKRRRRGGSGGVGGKSQPLSKYRRKTANARERSRMREINEAFDTLRRAVPVSGEGGERLTKISTLRLAMSYIAALSEALATSAPPSISGAESPHSQCASVLADPVSDLDDFDVFGPASLDFDDFLAIDIT